MMKIQLLLALASLCGPAFACDPTAQLVLACTTTQGKLVEVCQATDTVRYRYGRHGKPAEIELAEPNASFDWQGDGGSGMDTDDLTFHNGATLYTISYSNMFDHVRADGSVEGGVDEASLSVRRDGRRLADFGCRAEGLEFHPERLKATRRPYRP